MKLSFSTRGWNDMSWSDILDSACEMHFSGIEIYNVFKTPEFVAKGGPFHKYSLMASLRELNEKNLSIPCFDSSLDLSEDNPDMIAEMQSMIGIASDMHCQYVCAFAKNGTVDTVKKNLAVLIPLAESKNVTILIKTSGIYSDTTLLRDLMNFFACDQLAVIWDVHHPYRDKGETPSQTITNLGAYIKHVHLRDSDDANTYNIIGEGNFPIADVMRALSSVDYDGFISLEWKPEWMLDFTDRDVIFPHFVNYMGQFENTRGKKKGLYPNHDGTGYYIWKKDELLNLTFSKVLDRVVEEFPDQYCFKYTTLDYTRTYSEFRDDVDDFARALVSLGVKPGSKVAVWCTNIPAWYITFWATVKIGAVLVER